MKSHWVLLVLLLVFHSGNACATDLVFDGEFVNWTYQHEGDKPTAAVMNVKGNDGNPDECIEGITVLPSLPGMYVTNLIMIKNDLVYRPSTDGPLEMVSLTLDARSVSGWGSGQGVSIVIYQSGEYYTAPHTLSGSDMAWHQIELGPFAAVDFGKVYPYNTAINPDFSQTGGDIQFGLIVANSVQDGECYSYVCHYDNLTFALDKQISGVDTISARYGMSGNFPNPFNPRTTIAYELPKQTAVSLRVFDLSGCLVRVLVDGVIVGEGHHESIWNGRDDTGRRVASGTYFYRLEAGDYSETKRMVLVK